MINRTSGQKILLIVFLIAWTFAAFIVSQLLVGYIALWILGRDAVSQPITIAVMSVISYVITLILVLFVPNKIVGKWNREEIGLQGTPTWTDIGLSVVGFIVATLIGTLLAWIFSSLFPWFNVEEAQDLGFTPYMTSVERAFSFILLVIIAPIVEELVFRGWFYGEIRNELSAPLSILITSVLFGVAHLQWNVGVNVFALSLVLCSLREITGTIYSGILVHMIKNGVAFYFLYVIGFM